MRELLRSTGRLELGHGEHEAERQHGLLASRELGEASRPGSESALLEVQDLELDAVLLDVDLLLWSESVRNCKWHTTFAAASDLTILACFAGMHEWKSVENVAEMAEICVRKGKLKEEERTFKGNLVGLIDLGD